MQKFFRYIHSDADVKKKSSSGGAFTMISDYYINNNGVVYGCVLDDKNDAVHIKATNKSLRDRMRGSKYIQSDMGDIFESIIRDLKDGRKVLFSGTPCQCAAVYSYLSVKKIDCSKLLTVEVICHGVGSRKFFKDYLSDKEKKYNSKAVRVSFRAKHRRGQKEDIGIWFENGKEYHSASTRYDWWCSVYFKNYVLRPSCYKCKYAKRKRFADISIADFWGEEKKEDYSLIVSNSEKGNQIIENNKIGLLEEVKWENVHQAHMLKPAKKPEDRMKFWMLYTQEGYYSAQRYMGNNTFKGKMRNIIAVILQATHLKQIAKYFLNKR